VKTRLMDVNLLDVLSEPDLAELRNNFNTRTYPGGAIIFGPHHNENLVFVVAQGKARLYLSYGEKDFTLSILTPGDIYTTHTSATVEALDDMEILVIPTDRLAALLSDHPILTRTMVHVLGDILHSAFDIINSLAFKDIPRRITELLLATARENGEKTEEGISIRLSLTTQHIASIVGSSRQSVSETISKLEKDGLIIRQGRGAFLIPDIRSLENITSLSD